MKSILKLAALAAGVNIFPDTEAHRVEQLKVITDTLA